MWHTKLKLIKHFTETNYFTMNLVSKRIYSRRVYSNAVNFVMKKSRESKASSRERFFNPREIDFLLKNFREIPIPEVHIAGKYLGNFFPKLTALVYSKNTLFYIS